MLNLMMNFLQKGYSSNAMNDVARILCKQAEAAECDIYMYEPYADRYRLVGSTRLDLKQFVGTLKISSFDKNEVIENNENSLPVEIKYEDKVLGFVVLANPQNRQEKIESTMEGFRVLLALLASYVQLQDETKRHQSMRELTESFYRAKNISQLEEETVILTSKILDAQAVFFIRRKDSSYTMTAHTGVAAEQIISKSIPLNHPLLSKMEKKPQGTLFLKPNLDFVTITAKSLVSSPVETDGKILGLLIAVNKKAVEGYRTHYHFDKSDLSTLREIAKRFSIACSRLKYQSMIENENKQLREYTERYEEMIKNQQLHLKKMNIVHSISNALRSSYDPNNVYKILLLGLTSGKGFAFNRALLFQRDKQDDALVGKMWLGPNDEDNVMKIWKEAEERALRYGDFSQYLREEAIVLDLEKGLTQKIKDFVIGYMGHPIFERVVLHRKILHITPPVTRSLGNDVSDILSVLGVEEFVVVPIVGRWDTIGVVVLDNKFTGEPVNEMDLEILKIIADSAGLALENAMNYDELRKKTLGLQQQRDIIDHLRKVSESILQSLDTAIIVVNKEGKVLECNKKLEQLLMVPRERIVDFPLRDMGEFFEAMDEIAMKVFDTGETISLSSYRTILGHKERFFDIKFSPLWGTSKRQMSGVIMAMDDVTEQYKLEQERKDREKLAALGEMSARVAHELRNPIMVIGGFLKRLKKNIDDPQARERYMDIVTREVENLENIVSEILEFSKEKRGIELNTFDMNDLVDEVVTLMEEKAAQQGITVEKILDPTSEVKADRARLKRVLINLVQNAIEATPKHGKIRVKTLCESESFRVSVWNSGEPISEDVARKVFIPFFTTKTYGTGLGLAICKKIIEEEHNGRMWAEPKVNGTEFSFEIPLKREEEDNGKETQHTGD